VDVDHVRGYLNELRHYQSTELVGLHPRVLREKAHVMVRSLCLVFACSWRSGKLPNDLAKCGACIFQKGAEDELGNERLFSFTLVRSVSQNVS